MFSDIRVPLIVFTPKSLLRHPLCTSTLADFTQGHFLPLIEDAQIANHKDVDRLILCSGKIYYELDAARKEKEAHNISIVRIEQLYPFPQQQLDELLTKYKKGVEIVWVQEEPINMGGAMFVKHQLGNCTLRIISRAASGVTAEGLTALHKINQAAIIEEAINVDK